MSDIAKNISKFLHFTDALCNFADNTTENNYNFYIVIDDDEFTFDLPKLVAEIRKYRQAVIDDIESFDEEGE